MKDDTISRAAAVNVVVFECGEWRGLAKTIIDELEALPPAQPEYKPVTAEDFAKTMSRNTLYSFMRWHSEALELMEGHGFVICKKTI